MTADASHLDDEALALLITEGVNDKTSPALLEHLDDCPVCAARARDLAGIVEGLQVLGEEHRQVGYPGDLVSDLISIRARKPALRWRHYWPLAAAAVLVCSMTLLVFRRESTRGPQQAPVFPTLTELRCPGTIPSLSQLARLRPGERIVPPGITLRGVMPIPPRGTLERPRLERKGDHA